ncbi:hypothetical protein [Salinivirga cyanobacteriivorans]
MENKKVSKKIIEGLKAEESKKQIEAIDDIRKDGNVTYLPYLADLYVTSNSTEIKDKISAVFQDIKHSDGVQTIVSLLKNTSNKDLRSMLLTACWSSSLDFSKYLIDFVDIALECDYLVTFEVVTVVENFENIPPANDLEQAIGRLRGAVGSQHSSKRELLLDLLHALEDFRNNG